MDLSRKQITVVQPTGTNLHAVIDSGTISLPTDAATQTTLAICKTALEL